MKRIIILCSCLFVFSACSKIETVTCISYEKGIEELTSCEIVSKFDNNKLVSSQYNMIFNDFESSIEYSNFLRELNINNINLNKNIISMDFKDYINFIGKGDSYNLDYISKEKFIDIMKKNNFECN